MGRNIISLSNMQRSVKWGQEGIACDNCDLWYHRECMTMTSDSYHRFADNSSLIWLCKVCNTPNHCSILYQSINSDDNQFSSLSDIDQNVSCHSSLNSSLSTINSPLGTSSPKPENKPTRLNSISP